MKRVKPTAQMILFSLKDTAMIKCKEKCLNFFIQNDRDINTSYF